MKKPNPDGRKPPENQRDGEPDPASVPDTELRRRAESRLAVREEETHGEEGPASDADTRRLLHELQVHQIELEMQNQELQESRDRAAALLDKYIELYDFSPAGYFTLDEHGVILEVNLTGAALLGEVRSRLIGRMLSRFAEPSERAPLLQLLAHTFDEPGKQVGEVRFKPLIGPGFWAALNACPAFSDDLSRHVCRLAVTDITARKEAEEARRRVETLTHSNEELKAEIARRRAVEAELQKSGLQQIELLDQAHDLQEKLKKLSRSNLHTMEKERKRISRDLHDDVVQTLVGINFHLVSLSEQHDIPPETLKEKIVQTQRLVEKSVQSILSFAQALRPPGLDDLGLVASLNTQLEDFIKRTGIRVSLQAADKVDQLSGDQRIALYRIVQTALANVEEHSRATRVTIRLSETAEQVQLRVTDNGRSFDVPGQAALRSGKHLGLISMRERAEMMGGTFRIESGAGKGTVLFVEFPLI
ncbi:MAG: PAS domain S-box protein [Verrucomicrobia bacterium]|nr:PAS domain S-box protein [Verrucomicrobiota bacterium]MCH8527321.1 histidine kinase [Kiritimatiellia bacterium]